MAQDPTLVVFRAQVDNVRSLKSAMRQVHRSINEGLRSDDSQKVNAFTKIYALLFCAWAEANFSKMIHTPYGLSSAEIEQIQRSKEQGITVAWKKCVELGLLHLNPERGSFQSNAKKLLGELIDSYVYDPSLLRNKLAHGQWIVALNRNNTSIQQDLSRLIQDLDVVKVSGWMKVHQLIADLIESLIETPKKRFKVNWYEQVQRIEAAVLAASALTLNAHVAVLKARASRVRTVA